MNFQRRFDRLGALLHVGRGVCLFLIPVTWAQEVIQNPEQLLNDYVSIGEFNESGDVDGWGHNASSVTLRAANGGLEVVTLGGDPWFFRSNIPGGTADFDTVEVRLRVLEGSQTGWEMFWGTTATPGYVAGRRIGWSPDLDDSEFHIVHFDMSTVLDGSVLTHFRIDPTSSSGVRLEVDYARLGKVSPDADGDGLPDSVETNTGVLVDARDTGSDPNKADTDGDGFSDAVEVQAGTNPSSAAEMPIPGLAGYTISSAVYVVTIEISPSEPIVQTGNATGYAIAPALPDGLRFDTTTGRIAGTPSEVRPAADYTVTARFASGETDTTALNIEVRNPYIEYTVSKRSLLLGQAIPDYTFVPNIFGPNPTSYSISPKLPDGLLFDSNAGDIYDMPLETSSSTVYTVTAKYDGFPEAATTLILSVLGNPEVTTDPEEAIDEIISLGEFESEDDLTPWSANPQIAPLSVQNGWMIVETVGADPFMSVSFDPTAGCQIVELRMRLVEGTGSGFQTFWQEDAIGRSNFGAPGQPFDLPAIIDDGEFHIYRIDYTPATEGPLEGFRLDPGAGAGNLLDIDYIRLLGCTQPASIAFERGEGNMMAITWTGILQSADAIAGGWTTIAGESPLIITLDKPQQFYRAVNE